MMGTATNPYPPINAMSPWSQQHQNVVSQAQSGQPPMVTYTGIYSNIQEGQASIQTANPTIQDSTTKFKEEAKTLGAIQIIIGVMHVGFGIILGLMNTSIGGVLGFGATSFISGYNFWGGISFIVSGSLSIPASKMVSPCLIKGSLGMNIVSAIFSMIGVILLLVDMIINGNPWQDYWALISGKGISAMLMISAILEFCIACVLAHFATQVISNHTAPVLFLPTVYGNPVMVAPSSAPPRNNGQPMAAPQN